MSHGTRRTWRASLAIVAIAATVAACGGTGSGAAASADPTRDKLAQIMARGTLVAYAATDYPPQSIVVEGASRAASTKCKPNQMTADELTGFDIETTKVVAEKLGVEVCFVVPTWTEATAGNWNDRMDIVYGSGAINATRMEHLYMTQPYYYVPQRFVVRADSAFNTPSDLDGKTIGTCSSCTVESYLKGTLEIPGIDLVQKVKDPKLEGFETEPPGLEALAAGELDAFLTAEPVAQQAIDDGLPLRLLDETAFSMYPSGFVDKGSSLSAKAFVDRVNQIISAAHADGTLKKLSDTWFGSDYTTQAGAFDLSVIGQEVK